MFAVSWTTQLSTEKMFFRGPTIGPPALESRVITGHRRCPARKHPRKCNTVLYLLSLKNPSPSPPAAEHWTALTQKGKLHFNPNYTRSNPLQLASYSSEMKWTRQSLKASVLISDCGHVVHVPPQKTLRYVPPIPFACCLSRNNLGVGWGQVKQVLPSLTDSAPQQSG